MNINTALVEETISNLLIRPLTAKEQLVLERLQGSFLTAAKMTAHSFSPDGRTHFQYQETISSSQVEALNSEVTKELADASITFQKNTGTGFHKIQAIFPVVKS